MCAALPSKETGKDHTQNLLREKTMEFNQGELIQIIAQNLDLPEKMIKPASSFKEDLGADSLDLVELAMSIEDRYGLSIPSEEAEKFLTVQEVIDYLKGANN
jgi:acyl carrier protein